MIIKNIYLIILNWNQKENTLETLDSLRKMTYPDYKIVVVDNNSTDGSQETIRINYPGIILIENKENLGYAEGNNTGIRYALVQGADYIFVLNNDILVDEGALLCLLEEMERDKSIGVAGPKVYFYTEKNMIQSAGGLIHKKFNPLHIGFKELDHGQFDDPREIDYVSGCAMFIRRNVFEKNGLFDPDYFMYWEETDFCFRAKKAGFKIQIVPQAKIWHKGGVDSTPLIAYYMTRNKLFFLKKHKLGYLNILRSFIDNFRTILSWTVRPKWKNKKKERDMLIIALFDFWQGKFGRANIK